MFTTTITFVPNATSNTYFWLQSDAVLSRAGKRLEASVHCYAYVVTTATLV